MLSQFAIPSKKHLGGYLPYAFTEQGVAMLSSVLNSERAIMVNIQIMRAFTKFRKMLLSYKDLKEKIEKMEEKYDHHFKIVFDAIKQLLEPPEKPEHKPVNKILSDLMYDIGYIEKYGSGIYLENELCLKNGNEKPVYEITTNQTKVIFKSQVKDVTVIELDEKVLEGLNERQREIIEYFKSKGTISRKEYVAITNVSPRQANKDLKDLLDKKVIVQIGKGRNIRYSMHD